TGGLELPPKTIGHDPRFQQEAVIARIILKEHYGMVPTFEEGFADNQDGRLILDKAFDSLDAGLSMDLGQEWFELSGYPMLWGVFATRKGEADDSVIRQMQSIVRTSEAKQAARLQTEDIASEMLEFFSDHLRMRFDDLAIAGLTEFRQYLFYSGVLDEVTELPVVFLKEDEEEEEDDDRGPKLF
ncbi:MAG: MqnA/MqnD/SBP family protein, partial [Rhodothermales bacterium]